MQISYPDYRSLGLDLGAVGFIAAGEDDVPYFCTPQGAQILGRAGVDGIHFCTVPALGETVFAVSPENDAPNFVHPVAETFSDFLRLLLACGDTSALEQAWMWDEARFDAFLEQCTPDEAGRDALARLADATGLTPMDAPYAYLAAQREGFDPGTIPYSDEYYEVVGEEAAPECGGWAVYYDGNFYGHNPDGQPGTELALDARFSWAGRDWCVPAVYVCAEGLVVDLCMRVEGSALRAFLAKWGIRTIEDEARIPEEKRAQFALENPLLLRFQPRLTLGGQTLSPARSCSFAYIPGLSDACDLDEQREVMAHYGLDRADGWLVSRYCYPLQERAMPLRALSLTMKARPQYIPGESFTLQNAGDSFAFTHPETNVRHTITALELAQQTISLPENFPGFPSHCLELHYRVTPPLSAQELRVRDTAPSDPPREIPQAVGGAASIGIIGGSDGPTAILYGAKTDEAAAVSSLHFDPVTHVTWRLSFLQTPCAPETFPLLP